MPRKILLFPLAAALFLSGCAGLREKSLPTPPPAPTAVVPTAPPAVSRDTAEAKPRAISRPVPRATPQTSTASKRADLPAMIGDGAAWTSSGFQSLAVRRGTAAQQPVPIFRQAGTLAAVRAALADSPAQPQAEFRNGVLTLRFARGSNEEIASAVKKTLSVTGDRNLQVALQP